MTINPTRTAGQPDDLFLPFEVVTRVGSILLKGKKGVVVQLSDYSKPQEPLTPPAVGVMLELVLGLYRMGFCVIPLGDPFSPIPSWFMMKDTEAERVKKWCKTPRIKWGEFQTRRPTEAEIRHWWKINPFANIGIVTGHTDGIVVTDADSDQANAWLEQNTTPTPLKVKTSRGVHRYYRVNPDLAISNSSCHAVEIDIRGQGGYVVGPGSTYANGVKCEWITPPTAAQSLPMLGADDLSAINRYQSTTAARTQHPTLLPTDGDGTPTLFDMAALKQPHDGSPVAPGGRNNALASLVGQWVQQGHPIQRIHSEAKRWNQRNPQPLSESEIATTVTSIVSTHVKRHGTLPQAAANTPNLLQVWPLGELEDHPPAQPETYWREGVLFRGARLLLGGAPKVGKSAFIIQMGIAAACGGEFLGHRFERPIRVLWMQAEIHKSFLYQRLQRATLHLEPAAKALARTHFFASGRCDLDLGDSESLDLTKRVLADARPDFVIFDPVINFASMDENNNAEVRALLRSVDALGEEFNCATALVHHLRKGADSGDFNAIRGATAFRGWFDTGLMLSANDGGLTLAYELRNTAQIQPQSLEIDSDSGALSVCELQGDFDALHSGGSSSPSRHNGNPRATVESEAIYSKVASALELLRRSPNGFYTNELVEKLQKVAGCSSRTAKTILSELTKHPQVLHSKTGRHALYQFNFSSGQEQDRE